MNSQNSKTNTGQVIIINVLLFFAISVAIMFGIVGPTISTYLTTKSFLSSKQSFLLANSSVEEAIYRMRNDFEFSDNKTVNLSQGSANIIVSNTADGKQIDVSSQSDGFVRNLKILAITGVGANFNYGIQVGNGGFYLSNNAKVIGNVYANGSITGSNGSIITGSAIAAASAPEQVDQSNEISGTPSHQVTFAVSGTPDIAQSFTSGTTSYVGKISFYIKRTNSPSDAIVRIHSDNAGQIGNILGTGNLIASQVTNNYGWVDIVFPSGISVTENSKYWITVDSTVQNNRSYTIGAQDAYSKGKSKIGTYNSSWSDISPSGLDIGFRVFVGTNDSIISGVIVGDSPAGDAWADTVSNSVVSGTIYCNTGTGNNKNCDTSRSNPDTLSMPLSQANIDQFISEAESGTIISGNYVASSTTYLGPAVIEGDLLVDGTLILTGTLYVKGNITTGNNSIIRLDAGYSNFSGVILSSGTVSLSNNVQFEGSGQSNSYVLLLSTSDCPYGGGCNGASAIDVSNNVGTVILSAQDGKISFSNNAGAKSATAKMIYLNQNVTITYDSGLADLNFSSGPSGGWNISSWQEVE